MSRIGRLPITIPSGVDVTIDGATVLRPIDGFRFSQAFGPTSLTRSMPASNQQQA